MSKYRSARTVLAGAAIIALAGCTVSSGTAPDVPGQATGNSSSAPSSPGASTAANGTSPAPGSPGASASATSKSLVSASSLPFPVNVGNTWLYQTRSGANGEIGLTTNRIISGVPTTVAYQVTMATTTQIAGSTVNGQEVYLFYPDGRIGYPVSPVNGISIAGGTGVVWPDAAGIASGGVYHSVVRIRANGTYENADVTVQGTGMASVTVPAGTYQAAVVDTAITAKVGNFTTTLEVKNWIAQGTGPVKTEVLIHAGGTTKLIVTEELLSFRHGPIRADGS